jgi:integrase
MVPVPIAGTNRRKWVSTGCRTLAEAAAIVQESGVNRLVALANSQAVTEAAIQIITAGRKVTCAEILGSLTMESDGRWAASTLAVYRTQIQAFFTHCSCLSKPLIGVRRDQIMDWVNHGGAALGTRKARMSAIRTLYRYARANNFVLINPADLAFVEKRNMSHGELEPKIVMPITHEEYRRIVESPLASPFWRTATSISYWCGLRFSDVVCLEWASVTENGLIVWTRKKGRRVELPLADPLLGGGYLISELQAAARNGPYLFPVEREQCLSGRRSRFPTAFAVLLAKLGIEGKSFHGCRHACASRLAAAGTSIDQIGRILGHGDAEVTKGYIHEAPPN